MALPSAPPSYSDSVPSKDHPFPDEQMTLLGQQQPDFHQQPYSIHHQSHPDQEPVVQPSTVPVHANWVFAQSDPHPGYSSGYAPAAFSPSSQPSTSGNIEANGAETWNNQIIRHTFIRKVYVILMLQLMTTFGIVAVFTFCGVFISTYLVLACCSRVRRSFPWNLILLSIFTLALSYMAGMLSTFHNTKTVLLCTGITALVCFAVTIFSFQTKIDFTSCHGLLFGLIMGLLLTGLVMAFTVPFGYVPWLQVVYAGLGAVAFTLQHAAVVIGPALQATSATRSQQTAQWHWPQQANQVVIWLRQHRGQHPQHSAGPPLNRQQLGDSTQGRRHCNARRGPVHGKPAIVTQAVTSVDGANGGNANSIKAGLQPQYIRALYLTTPECLFLQGAHGDTVYYCSRF
ncbi:protein lifeguard 2a isoform X3 [Narcine bancroftii]|uniref:protein lifeguard 2a isoform X3 n=1 Tax=Narcine bancroftii TaxID=1343680 RepID=UPI0038312524